MKQLFALLIPIFLLAPILNAQSQKEQFQYAENLTLQGVVTDQSTGEGLPFATVVLKDSLANVITGTQTDFDGKYLISGLNPGIYLLQTQYVAYTTSLVEAVKIDLSKKTWVVNVQLEQHSEMLDEIVVVEYKMPLIRKSLSMVSGVTRSKKGRKGRNKTVSKEEYNNIDDNSWKKAKKNPLSTFSIDVDKAAYSNIRRYINDGQLPPENAVRIEEMVNYFPYDYPAPMFESPFSISPEYMDCPWNKENKLLHLGIKGMEIEMSSAAASNLTFLIDVSGSMNSADKLGLLKSGLYLLIDQLRDKDKVAIVVYAGAAGIVLPSTKGKDKDKIKNAIEQLKAGGSTAGGAGIKLAYKVAMENFIEGGNNRVILATDGDFNVGISGEDGLVKLIEEKRESGIFLSVLGFGTGNLKDSKMEQVANHGNGNYHYIDNILEAKKVLVNEIGGTLITIAKDVKIQMDFNEEFVESYRQIGYVNRQLENKDFDNDKKDAGELGSGHSVTVIYEIKPTKLKKGGMDIEKDKRIALVKLRYKATNKNKSKFVSAPVFDKDLKFDQATLNGQFAASVASFGMLLRNSEFKGASSFDQVIAMAQKSKGKDIGNYRSEFISLVEAAKNLKRTE